MLPHPVLGGKANRIKVTEKARTMRAFSFGQTKAPEHGGKGERKMITLVRKFSVTIKGEKCKVLFIEEDKNGFLHFHVAHPDGRPETCDAQNVGEVYPDE